MTDRYAPHPESAQARVLVWAVIELAQGHFGNAVALVVMFEVLQAPRLLRLPWAFDAALLVAWTLQAGLWLAGWAAWPRRAQTGDNRRQ